MRNRRRAVAPPPTAPQQWQPWEPMPPAPPARCLRRFAMVTCEPAPFDIALDHQSMLTWSDTINGPAMFAGSIINDALESLGAIALGYGADGLYSVRLDTAVDNGWMYATAMATATIAVTCDET